MKSVSTLNDIGAPVAEELSRFGPYMREQMRSKTALLDTVVRYIMKQQGKRVRPTLVFLSAGLCGPISDRSFVLDRGAIVGRFQRGATPEDLMAATVVDPAFNAA